MIKIVIVIKANGDRVEFSESRLLRSLIRAGAEKETAKNILLKIKPHIKDLITTKIIYNLAFKELRKVDSPTASRYESRWAIIRLGRGQQGFSFEQFISRLFERIGYKVKLNQLVQGKSINHEVDLIAEKDDERIMIECKHKSKPGIWINVQTPLYVYARFLDLEGEFSRPGLITNSRFSRQSEIYGESVNMLLLSWNYPQKNNLRDLVDKHALYPITVLRSIDNGDLSKLLFRNIVVVADILETPQNILARVLGKDKALKIIEEAKKTAKYKISKE